MADFSQSDRTEAPTPRRLDEARRQGRVALSTDMTAAILLFLSAAAMSRLGPQLATGLSDEFRAVLTHLPGGEWSLAETQLWGRWLLTRLLGVSATILLGCAAAGGLATVAQVGWHVSGEGLQPRWERISPATGWQRLLSREGLLRGVLALLKWLTALVIAWAVVGGRLGELVIRSRASLRSSAAATWELATALTYWLAVAAVVMASADYLLRRIRHERELRMTRQEVRDELRDDQGDPQLRARRRAAHRQLRQRQSLQRVPEATLVVTNPTHVAVALRYRSGQSGAPRVIAKGTGRLALAIRERARDLGIPVQEHKPLARALYQLVDLDEEIPAEMYHAVAEILAAIYRRRSMV